MADNGETGATVNAGVISNGGDVTVTGAAIGSVGGTPSWWGNRAMNVGVISNTGDVTVTGTAIGAIGSVPAVGTPSWWGGGTGVVNVGTVGTVNARTSSPVRTGAQGTPERPASWGGAARPSTQAGGQADGSGRAPAGLGVEVSGPAQCLRGGGSGATRGVPAGSKARPQQAPSQSQGQGQGRVRRGVWAWLWQWIAGPIHQAPDPIPDWLAALLLRASDRPSSTSGGAS